MLLPAPGRAHWSRLPDSASGACFAPPGSSRLHPFPPLRPPPLSRLCSGASLVLRVYVTSGGRSSRGYGLGLSFAACSRSFGRQPPDLSVLARGVVRVHAPALRPRQIQPALALSSRSMLPSAWIHRVGIWKRCFRGSITLPAHPRLTLRLGLTVSPHSSGSDWFATPCLYETFTHYSAPVYPDARILRFTPP